MAKIYGVALIGCGHVGEVHLENIYYKDNVNIRCVCDVNEEKARICMRKYNADRFETDVDRCLDDDEVFNCFQIALKADECIRNAKIKEE